MNECFDASRTGEMSIDEEFLPQAIFGGDDVIIAFSK
jgi:hypothetical protein